MNFHMIRAAATGQQKTARRSGWLLALLLGAFILQPLAFSLRAYPPAPFHLFYGMLRDEYGTPINLTEAEVVLEAASGVKVRTAVNPGIETAANYRLEVPMDAGLMAAPYQPSALRPFVSFRLKVRIGGTTYLPMEMAGDYANLGQPGRRTRLNLTLGEDSDGDGLPDAWERLVNPDIAQVAPGADAGNGLNYLQTYFAGTYGVDPKNGFALTILGLTNGVPQLEFLAINGRTYTLLGSRDLKTWSPVSFRIPAEGASPPARRSFQTDAVKTVRMEMIREGTNQPPTSFRLMLE